MGRADVHLRSEAPDPVLPVELVRESARMAGRTVPLMTTRRLLDDGLLREVNEPARHTGAAA